MKLIVGLGNPGEKYKNTRHNIGFLILDKIAKKTETVFKLENKFESEIGEGGEIKFIKPQTFMNESGKAIRKVKNFYKVANSDIIVIHDDVDLEFGKVRVNFGGSSAGHKGIQSIIENIGEDFWRVRVGVGKSDRIPTEEWVLQNFVIDDQEKLSQIIDEISEFVVKSAKDLKEQTINVGE